MYLNLTIFSQVSISLCKQFLSFISLVIARVILNSLSMSRVLYHWLVKGAMVTGGQKVQHIDLMKHMGNHNF